MGVMAVVALCHDIIFVLGVYSVLGKEISPNTLAALLTILGYSLYDTVVVFHRINDNMANSSERTNFITMANHSINQVFMRSINTTLTSVVPVIGMLFFGGSTLQDFALAMAIGLICGAYSSIGIAVPLYAWWKNREPKNYRLMRKFGTEPSIFCFVSPQLAPEVGLQNAIAATDSEDATENKENAQSATKAMTAADKAAAEAKAAKRLGFDENSSKKTKKSRSKRNKSKSTK